MKKAIVHTDYIDPTPGKSRHNLIDPEVDLISVPEGESDKLFAINERLTVTIQAEDGRWDTLATIKDVYEDEFGVLLGVQVDWGNAVLVPSEA